MRTLNLKLAVLVFLLAGNASVVIAQLSGTFTPTGDMSFPRSGHTATLLANGKVLIVGGGAAAPSSSAELYDPDTRTFIPAGNMTTPRAGHTATLLNDGRVLIVGGDYVSGAPHTNTAELYDPKTGTFTSTGGTVTNQFGGWAVLVNNGKVLVAGGVTAFYPSYPIATPELYDPSTGAFTPTGAFVGGLDIAAVSLLPDGRVLFAGEPNSEVYDPITGSFSLTGSMTIPGCYGQTWADISGRTATLLQSGKVLLTGGEQDCGRFANAELYDPATGQFTPTGNMTRARVNHTATLLPDGTVLLSGGETEACNGGFCIYSGTTTAVEVFDPATGSFQAVGNMNARRAAHTATLLMNGTILLAGGWGSGGIGLFDGSFSSAEIYSPPVPLATPVVTDLRFDRTIVAVGESFTADFAGSNMTPEMFFDVRFTAPGSTFSDVGFNWQKGPTSSHLVPAGLASGVWTINGVRAHRFEDDHAGNFFPVTAAITVTQLDTFSIVDRGGVSWRSSGTSAANVVVGYASIQPNSGSTMPAGLAIVGYRHNNVLVTEASVPASPLIQSGRIYAEVNDPVHTGLAIANPNSQPASVSFFFTDSNGNLDNGNTTIPANGQIAKFLDEFPFNGRSSWSGTFTFNSSVPIAVTAMRVRINERGEFLTSTLPVVDLNTPAATGTISFPEFADGSGWATEIVLVNPTDSVLSGTVQFVDALGRLASVAVNGQLNTSFPYSIAAGSSQQFQTGGASTGVLVGSVRVVPATKTPAPSGLAIFSFRSGGNTVTEAGVSAMAAGTGFRLYAEIDGPIQTAIAVANNSTDAAAVQLELSKLDGASTGRTGTLSIPPNGQTALFLNEVPEFTSLPTPFHGVLRVSSPISISMIGLRIRYNERNDVLITPTPPVYEAAPPATSPMVFPQIVDSAGYTTQFILFSAQPGSSASGTLQLFNQSGGALGVPLQ